MPFVPLSVPPKVVLPVLVFVNNALSVPPPDNVRLAAPPIVAAPLTTNALPRLVFAVAVCNVVLALNVNVPEPSALLLSASRVPALNATPAEFVLLPPRINVPVPVLVRALPPAMIPL